MPENLFSKEADFELVKHEEEALMYHAVKFQGGRRYELARRCFQYLQERENAKNTKS